MEPFTYSHLVTIADTDLSGAVFYTNYINWLNFAREEMIARYADTKQILAKKLFLVTHNLSFVYLKPFFLFDKVNIKITIGRRSNCSGFLYARYNCSNSNFLHAVGKQVII